MQKVFFMGRALLLFFSLSFVLQYPVHAQFKNLFKLGTSEYHGSDIRDMKFGRDIRAIDESGEVFVFDDFKGQISLVFFGFTHCPDICPTTLAQLSQLKNALSLEEAKQLQLYFITVDPERDTPQRLKAYLSHFDADIKALTGSLEQVTTMAKSFHVFFHKVPIIEGHYTMEHSSFVFVLDKQGDSVLLFREGMSLDQMLSDLRQLLQSDSEQP